LLLFQSFLYNLNELEILFESNEEFYQNLITQTRNQFILESNSKDNISKLMLILKTDYRNNLIKKTLINEYFLLFNKLNLNKTNLDNLTNFHQ
jgi:hypothetical protein